MFMNYYSKSTLGGASLAHMDLDEDERCCVRWNQHSCTASLPSMGLVDLGAVLIRNDRYVGDSIKVEPAVESCNTESKFECIGAALARQMMEKDWSAAVHPPGACAVFQPESPKSCELVGGIWVDRAAHVGCYYVTDYVQHLPVLNMSTIKYDHFISSSAACIC